jgi:thiosulfate reductase/polysulfide reductase chain A
MSGQGPFITRRRFLAGTALSTGALALGASLWDINAWTTEARQEPVYVTPTICGGCGNRCAIYAHTKRGRIWKIEGIAEANGNRGYVCPKGHGYIHDLYNPDRIRQPLKREGNVFKPISWEDAYREIAEKLNLTIMLSGPQAIFWINFPQTNQAYALRFMHALGSPHYFTHGATCFTARNAGWNYTVGKLPANDMACCRYLMIIGRNPAGGVNLGQMADITTAKNQGAKIVVVDPRHNETAILADEWLPIKPGTDLALLLAMAYVLIEEKLYDRDFVAKNTIGFEALKKHIQNYPPSWAEEICEIPAQTITRLAREMAAQKPKALLHRGYHGGFGSQYLNSFQTVRALATVNALLGNINREGGLYFPPQPALGELAPRHPTPERPPTPKADGTGTPGRFPLGSYGDGIAHAIPELALREELKCGFVFHNNPLRTNPNPKRVMAGYKKLELLVVIDTVLSETASIAHYVLPESFYLEREEAIDTRHIGKRCQVTLQQAAVKPLFDSKTGTQIITDLAQRLGVGRFFEFTLEEANRLRLAPLGVTLEELREKGILAVGEKWKEGFTRLDTPSGKVEFHSATLEKLGYPPLPVWEEPLVSPDPQDKHSFRLLHGKQAYHTHAMTANQPYLMAVTDRYDGVHLLMNKKRGEELGLKDGELVLVKSVVGEGRIKVKLTWGLHPSSVWLPSGYGNFSRHLKTAFDIGISYNDFLPTMFDPTVGHVMASEVIVQVTRA